MKHGLSEIEILAQADLCLLAARLLAPTARPQGPRPSRSDVRELVSRAAAPTLEERINAVIDVERDCERAALQIECARLFEGAVVCPINETAYVRRDKGALLADICGFYEAFGFERDETCGEKPDHLVSELEFSAILLVMLTHATGSGADDASDTTYTALLAFWQDHLMPWWPAFSHRLEQTARHPFLQRVAALHEALHDYLSDRYGLPDPDAELVGPDAEEGTPYECGKIPQLVQLSSPTESVPPSGSIG
jgi:TorA maturation chaperone TorD